MFKKLLIFFRIIDEVQVPVPMQWKERIPVEKKPYASEEVKGKTLVEQKKDIFKRPVENLEKKYGNSEVPEKSLMQIDRKKEFKNKEKIKNFTEYTNGYQEYCLEKTSNQHLLKVLDYKVIDRNDTTETFFISKDAFIVHNEHQMLRIESRYFVKYIQQEFNPITQINENAYD